MTDVITVDAPLSPHTKSFIRNGESIAKYRLISPHCVLFLLFWSLSLLDLKMNDRPKSKDSPILSDINAKVDEGRRVRIHLNHKLGLIVHEKEIRNRLVVISIFV